MHFVAGIVKNARSPTFVLLSKFVGGLVAASAVEVYQAVSILAKVRRNPVQNDADARFVKLIYQIFQVVGSAVATCGRIKPRYLITPRCVQWIFGKGQKFNVRIAYFFDVRHKIFCQIPIGIHFAVVVPAPRTGMHFVDVYGGNVHAFFALLGNIIAVRPLERAVRIVNNACRFGTHFGIERVRIGFVQNLSAACGYGKLVAIAVLGFQVGLPNAVHQCHYVVIDQPIVKIAYHRHGFCVGRPHRKTENTIGNFVATEQFVGIDCVTVVKFIVFRHIDLSLCNVVDYSFTPGAHGKIGKETSVFGGKIA